MEPNRCKLVLMKTSVDLDEELQTELDETVSLVREKPATVLRLAIRAGLPVVANRFQSPRPAGYFSGAYKTTARAKFEAAMAKGSKQRPER